MLHIAQIKGGNTLVGNVNELKGSRFSRRIERITATAEQVEFSTQMVPNSMPVVFSINGISYIEEIDYTVDRANKLITWINSEIVMEADWVITIEYCYQNTTGVINVPQGTSGGSGTYDDSLLVQQISSVSNRVTVLENKADNDTVYDDTALAARVSDIEQHLNALDGSVSSLEEHTDNDTIYDDTSLVNRVTALETQMTDVLSRLSTLESYFTSGVANTATVAYAIPNQRMVTDMSTRTAIWYEESGDNS